MRRRLFFGVVALAASGFRKLLNRTPEPAITMSFSGKDLPYPLQPDESYHVTVMKAGTFKIVTTPSGVPIEFVHKEIS